MSNSIKNLYEFQITSKILQSDAATDTFTISNDILTGSAVSLTNASILLENRNGSKRELMKGDASGGTFTIDSRGIEPDGTTDTNLQYERPKGTQCKVVILEDQVLDKTAQEEIVIAAKTYATTAARDAALGGDGVATKNFTNIFVTATNLFYNYNTGTAQWEDIDTGTTTPNMSDTVTGIARQADQSQHDAGTDTESSNPLVSKPSIIQAGIQSGSALYAGASAVGTDAYAVTMTPTLTAYTTGMKISFLADVANTGACTIDVDSLGVKNIKTRKGNNPQSGDIIANTTVELQYDGTDFILQKETADSIGDKQFFTLGENMTALDIAVLRTDGSVYTFDGMIDSGVEYSTDTIQTAKTTYINDAETTIVCVYRDSGNDDIHIKAGTISAGAITFGSEYNIDISASSTTVISVIKVDDGAGVVAFHDTNTYYAVPFTVSGTTVTVGSKVQINTTTGNTLGYFGGCLLDTNKVLYAYAAGGASTDANMRVGSISANAISFGTEDGDFTGLPIKEIRCCQAGTDKAIVTMVDNNDDINITVPSISGTTITNNWANKDTYTGTAVHHTCYRVSDNLGIVVFDDTDIKAFYVSVSTTTPTIQSTQTLLASTTFSDYYSDPLLILNSDVIGVGDISIDNMIFCTKDDTNYDIDYLETIDYGALAGATVQFDNCNFLATGEDDFWAVDNNLTSKKVYLMNYDTRYILGILQTTGSTSDSILVALTSQISSGHSSLTPGEKYYIQYDGSVTTDPSGASMAGKAISATEMLVHIPYELN